MDLEKLNALINSFTDGYGWVSTQKQDSIEVTAPGKALTSFRIHNDSLLAIQNGRVVSLDISDSPDTYRLAKFVASSILSSQSQAIPETVLSLLNGFLPKTLHSVAVFPVRLLTDSVLYSDHSGTIYQHKVNPIDSLKLFSALYERGQDFCMGLLSGFSLIDRTEYSILSQNRGLWLDSSILNWEEITLPTISALSKISIFSSSLFESRTAGISLVQKVLNSADGDLRKMPIAQAVEKIASLIWMNPTLRSSSGYESSFEDSILTALQNSIVWSAGTDVSLSKWLSAVYSEVSALRNGVLPKSVKSSMQFLFSSGQPVGISWRSGAGNGKEAIHVEAELDLGELKGTFSGVLGLTSAEFKGIFGSRETSFFFDATVQELASLFSNRKVDFAISLFKRTSDIPLFSSVTTGLADVNSAGRVWRSSILSSTGSSVKEANDVNIAWLFREVPSNLLFALKQSVNISFSKAIAGEKFQVTSVSLAQPQLIGSNSVSLSASGKNALFSAVCSLGELTGLAWNSGLPSIAKMDKIVKLKEGKKKGAAEVQSAVKRPTAIAKKNFSTRPKRSGTSPRKSMKASKSPIKSSELGEPSTAVGENGVSYDVVGYSPRAEVITLVPENSNYEDKVRVPMGDFWEFYEVYDANGTALNMDYGEGAFQSEEEGIGSSHKRSLKSAYPYDNEEQETLYAVEIHNMRDGVRYLMTFEKEPDAKAALGILKEIRSIGNSEGSDGDLDDAWASLNGLSYELVPIGRGSSVMETGGGDYKSQDGGIYYDVVNTGGVLKVYGL